MLGPGARSFLAVSIRRCYALLGQSRRTGRLHGINRRARRALTFQMQLDLADLEPELRELRRRLDQLDDLEQILVG